MKCSLALLSVLGLTSMIYATPIKTTLSLEDDFNDFAALVPVEKISEILKEYIAEDAEFEAVIEYLYSEDFKEFFDTVEKNEHFITFLDYLQESGLDVYSVMDMIHDSLASPSAKEQKKMSSKIIGGISGFVAEVKAELPLEKFRELYYEKLENSEDFKEMIEKLKSPKLQEVIDKLFTNEEFLFMVEKAKSAGVNVKAVAELLSTVLGVKIPNQLNSQFSTLSIDDDFADFLELVPIADITSIVVNYLAEDVEVQAAFEYIGTDEFKDLLKKLQQEKDVYELLKYIDDSGFDIFSMINMVNEFLEVPPYPKPYALLKKSGGVQGMLNDIRAILPYDEFEKLYAEKMETSEEFKAFIERFKAPEFQKIIDALGENESFVELGCQAAIHGISLQNISDFLTELFGLKLPPIPEC